MSKAEDRALEAYPILMCYNDFQMVEEDINKPLRKMYQEGYHQAEKDLELTWQDIELIVNIDKDTNNEESIIGVRNNKEHYQEVLKRFKEWKETKD